MNQRVTFPCPWEKANVLIAISKDIKKNYTGVIMQKIVSTFKANPIELIFDLKCHNVLNIEKYI